jgi:SAM-dependent methyltransferase
MHLNGNLLFEKYARVYFKDHLKVLEIAPFGQPSLYSKKIGNPTIEWFSLDIGLEYIGNQSTNPNFILSKKEYNYPVNDDTFDIVLSDQVMGNVKLFWIWMEELKRITKPGGYIITINPVSYPKCPAPVDCWRIYPDGMKALNEYLGLKTILSEFDSLEFEHFGYSKDLKKIPNFRVQSESIATSNVLIPKMLIENKIKIIINRLIRYVPIIRRFMNPIRIAYDTITIAQK